MHKGSKPMCCFLPKARPTTPHQDKNCTTKTWVYDLRTNMPSFGKRTPFTPEHLTPFEAVFGEKSDGTSPRHEGEWSFTDAPHTMENSRWRAFDRDWIASEKGDSLDISWLKDNDSIDAHTLATPTVLAGEALAYLSEAMNELTALIDSLPKMENDDE